MTKKSPEQTILSQRQQLLLSSWRVKHEKASIKLHDKTQHLNNETGKT